MPNLENEFEKERIKVYMSQPTDIKLRFLEETKTFLEKVKDERTKRITEALKRAGF